MGEESERHRFPPTRHSLVEAAASADPDTRQRALELLVAAGR